MYLLFLYHLKAYKLGAYLCKKNAKNTFCGLVCDFFFRSKTRLKLRLTTLTLSLLHNVYLLPYN